MTRLMHYSREAFTLDRTREYSNTIKAGPYTKPRGFWVSVEGEQDWPAWCRSEEFRLDTFAHAYEVTIADGAPILWLPTPVELHAFTVEYGAPDERRRFGDEPEIDWARVAQRYDGLIIPTYQWSCRYDLSWYYGWDCASGCVWNLDVLTITEVDAPVMDGAAA